MEIYYPRTTAVEDERSVPSPLRTMTQSFDLQIPKFVRRHACVYAVCDLRTEGADFPKTSARAVERLVRVASDVHGG